MIFPSRTVEKARGGRKAPASSDQPVSLERFQPQTPVAKYTLEELLRRGALPVFANRDQVILKREGQTATLDAFGRLSWAAAAR
jgi:hypothetical protein